LGGLLGARPRPLRPRRAAKSFPRKTVLSRPGANSCRGSWWAPMTAPITFPKSIRTVPSGVSNPHMSLLKGPTWRGPRIGQTRAGLLACGSYSIWPLPSAFHPRTSGRFRRNPTLQTCSPRRGIAGPPSIKPRAHQLSNGALAAAFASANGWPSPAPGATTAN